MMNSTELSGEFQSAVVLAHHICGSITCVFNLFVCCLIVFDNDSRGKGYRKYLFSLQFVSTLVDACLDAYIPLVQANCCVIYADSEISKLVGIVTALAMYFVLMGQMLICYFFCIYYRRRMLLSRNVHFSFHGWKYTCFFAGLEISTIGIFCYLYYSMKELQSSDEIPAFIYWVKDKNSFLIVRKLVLNWTSLILAIGWGLPVLLTILLMIIQLVIEIKHGMAKASNVTKRYQTRAVFSLIMQGIVPSIFILIPAAFLSCLYVYSMYTGTEGICYNRQVSALSAICVNLMSFHAFVHSLTVLACAPSYRKNTAVVISRIFRPFRRLEQVGQATVVTTRASNAFTYDR